MSEKILEVNNLVKYFDIKNPYGRGKNKTLKAVDDVSFDVKKGDVLGLVGESGCGKSTLVNTVLRLIEPTSGEVIFDNKKIFELSKKELIETRKDIQIVFQDPFWSLNPRIRVENIIGEPLVVQKKIRGNELTKNVTKLLEYVGLPEDSLYKYPHEFSGGERQRIAIARALSIMPKLVVLDEPTSAIDVVSQNEILKMLLQIKEELGLTYILISHDISVINYMADVVGVMYLGKMIEYGNCNSILKKPMHPYTKALLSAVPIVGKTKLENITILEGNVPSAINLPVGCRFNDRCIDCMDVCMREEPDRIDFDDRYVICHKLRRKNNEKTEY
jgi:oligopeptide/dipeptide ABC transporter ATP-binding protein